MCSVEAGGWKNLQFQVPTIRHHRLPGASYKDAATGNQTIDGNLGMFGKPRKFLWSPSPAPLQTGFWP